VLLCGAAEVRHYKPSSVQEFISLVEQTNREGCLNSRMLRQAIHNCFTQLKIRCCKKSAFGRFFDKLVLNF